LDQVRKNVTQKEEITEEEIAEEEFVEKRERELERLAF
jgi:hypothetical protein